MRPNRLSLLLPVLALLPVGGARAQETTLRFAWPVGTEAHVRVTQIRDQETGGRPQTIELSAEYDLTLRPHPRGMLLDYSNYRNTGFRADPELPPDDPLRAILERLGSAAVDDVVSTAGELVEVGGVEEMTRVIREVITPLVDSASAADAEAVREFLELLVDEEQLLVAAQDSWAGQTGIWAGRTLVPGRAVRLRSEVASPLVPRVKIPVEVDLHLDGTVPCWEGSPDAGCVRLVLTSRADPGALQAAYRAMLTRMGYPQNAPIPIGGLSQETRVTVVAEPGTLLPHTSEVVRLVEGTMQRGSITRPFRQMEHTFTEYSYTRRP